MIKSFRHKGIQQLFETGSKAGISSEHEAKLARQLQLLNAAKGPLEMDVAGWKLHQLKGELAEHWTVKVNGNGGSPSRLKAKMQSWLIIKTITKRCSI